MLDSDLLQFELDIDAAERRSLKRKLYESDIAESVESFKGLDLNSDCQRTAASANKSCGDGACRCKAAKTTPESTTTRGRTHEVNNPRWRSVDANTIAFDVFF